MALGATDAGTLLARLKMDARQFSSEIGKTNKTLGGFSGTASKVGSSLKTLGKIATVTAAAIAAISIKVGKDFEQALTTTATIANATEKQLRILEKAARDIGATTAFTATEVANAMYQLVSAGLSAETTAIAVKDALFLAGATAADMTQATSIMSSTLKVFNLTAEDSKRISDVFAMAITNSMFRMDSLTEAMKIAAPIGATLGWTLEETTAAVAQFAEMGLEGSMSGTFLRMSMSQLLSPTEEVEKTIRKLGIRIEDINPATHTFAEILKTLAKTSITTANAVEIFGTRSGAAMASLIDRTRKGTLDMEGFLSKLQDSSGRAEEMYLRMIDTVQGKMKILISALSEQALKIFDVIKEPLKAALDNLIIMISDVDFTSFVKEVTSATVVGINAIVQAVITVPSAIQGVRKFVTDTEAVILEVLRDILWVMDKFKFLDPSGLWKIALADVDITLGAIDARVEKLAKESFDFGQSMEEWQNKLAPFSAEILKLTDQLLAGLEKIGEDEEGVSVGDIIAKEMEKLLASLSGGQDVTLEKQKDFFDSLNQQEWDYIGQVGEQLTWLNQLRNAKREEDRISEAEYQKAVMSLKARAFQESVNATKSFAKNIGKIVGLGQQEQAKAMIPFEIALMIKEIAEGIAAAARYDFAAAAQHGLAATQYAAEISQLQKAAKTGGGGISAGGGGGGAGVAPGTGGRGTDIGGVGERPRRAEVILNVGEGIVNAAELTRSIAEGLNEAFDDDVKIIFAES